MYIRRDPKRLKDGTEAVYVSLAHNVVENPMGDDKKARSKPVIYARLGREDQLDDGVVRGMRDALHRYLVKRQADAGGEAGTEEVHAAVTTLAPTLKLLASRQYGVRALVEPVWRSLGLQETLEAVAGERAISFELERVVFAMVLNRLVDPSSKRACNDWIKNEAWFPEADGWQVQHFYRALDVLHEHSEQILGAIGEGVRARLPDDALTLGLIDTTSSYFESDFDDVERAAVAQAWEEHDAGGRPEPTEARPTVVNDPAFRRRGHSKDHRPRAPQVKIGLCTAADGQLIHVEVVAGNTSDQSMTVELARRAQVALGTLRLAMVMDSGMGGLPNLKKLDAMGLDRISAVPLRGSKFAEQHLLAKPGRWREHPYKEGFTYRVVLVPADEGPTDRDEYWIATRNDKEARRQTRLLEAELARIKQALQEDDGVNADGKPTNRFLATPKRRRFVRPAKNGRRMILNRDRVRLERRRAGVHVLRSTVTDAPAEQSLRAYDVQYGIEGQFRTYKGPLKLRPMYHRATRRIQAHVLVCSMALMVLRELERATERTFDELRRLFGPVSAVRVEQGSVRFWQREEWSDEASRLLREVGAVAGPLAWGVENIGGAP